MLERLFMLERLDDRMQGGKFGGVEMLDHSAVLSGGEKYSGRKTSESIRYWSSLLICFGFAALPFYCV